MSYQIEYPRLVSHLEHIREHSAVPSEFSSHDSSNVQPSVPISEELTKRWSQRFHTLLTSSKAKALDLKLTIADGFLLYYDPRVRAHIDCRLFLRIGKDLLRERRENRGGYNTAEGVLWQVSLSHLQCFLSLSYRVSKLMNSFYFHSRSQDPPGYFDKSLWPSYLLAHESLFESKNVDGKHLPTPKVSLNPDYLSTIKRQSEGEKGGNVSGLVVLEAQEESGKPRDMNQLVGEACREIEKSLLQLGFDE